MMARRNFGMYSSAFEPHGVSNTRVCAAHYSVLLPADVGMLWAAPCTHLSER